MCVHDLIVRNLLERNSQTAEFKLKMLLKCNHQAVYDDLMIKKKTSAGATSTSSGSVRSGFSLQASLAGV